MIADNLDDWLAYLEQLHPTPMELGLERVGEVARAMALDHFRCPLITVGGTNGKGSTVSYLESIYRAAGYRTASQLSPHLVRFNERIRLDGAEATDADILRGLAAVEAARGDTSLTYFEYTVLAAVWLFHELSPDVVILEVGLGGRLDVTNLWDADAVIVTNIGLDHQRWLGTDREAIGYEKAHIARRGRPAFCGDSDAPQSLRDHWRAIGAEGFFPDEDFFIREQGEDWSWSDAKDTLALPCPGMSGGFQLANAAPVVGVVQALQSRLPVPVSAIADGLRIARIAGRLQPYRVRGTDVILDVGHNASAADALAQALADAPGRLLAVSAVMADKDLDAILSPLWQLFDRWFLGDIAMDRALPAADYASQLVARGVGNVQCAPDLTAALDAALEEAKGTDTVVVFGSNYTVADVIEAVTAAAD